MFHCPQIRSDLKPNVSSALKHAKLAGLTTCRYCGRVRNFSGKFMVRVPPETHRKLVLGAAESGVSLNRFIASKL
jgi:predicted HicB family RNase H-like nuclease